MHGFDPSNPEQRRGLLLLVLLTLIWGTNWPVMKMAVAEFPPWPFRMITATTAGIILLLLHRLQGGSLGVPRALWGRLAVAALFNVTLWHLGSAFGVYLIASGQASVIAFTMPVWAALLSAVFLGEPLTRRVLGALALGIAGVAVLMGEAVFTLASAPLGLAAMLLTAVSWAIGTILLKRTTWPLPVLAMAGWQIILGAIPIVAVGAVLAGIGVPSALWPDTVTVRGLLLVSYIVMVPLVFGYTTWNRIVRLFPVQISSIGTLMIPVVGVISGNLVLGESFGWRQLFALLLVCSALALVLFQPRASLERSSSRR